MVKSNPSAKGVYDIFSIRPLRTELIFQAF